jgi:hypothetical protein
MSVDSIRRIIATGKQVERRTHTLQQHFEHHLAHLRQQLVLPDEQPAMALVAFVERYINYVPEFIDYVMQSSISYGLQDSVAPFMHMAEDFFLAPPQELDGGADLHSLLDKAFLAQRLIEEVNDRYMQLRRTPLLPIDMTRVNIIVHHLIGDAPANRLDGLVRESVAMLIDHKRLFGKLDNNLATETSLLAIWQDLPCLSRVTAIDLRLGAVSQSSS